MTTTQPLTTIYADNDHEQPVRGLFHWVDLPDGGGVMYDRYQDEDGVEVMEVLYWRVAV